MVPALLGVGCGKPIVDSHRLVTVGLCQPGGKGELSNLSSADGDPTAPFDADKPTIVITHGLNVFPGIVRFIYPARIAEAIRQRCPGAFNLATWDWNAAAFFDPHFLRIRANAIEQGRLLANALQERGVGREVHLVGHSLGGLVITSAAKGLGGVSQLTLLDSVVDDRGRVFGMLSPMRHAASVENYWAPRPTGVGKAVAVPGLFNRQVRDQPMTRVFLPAIAPIRGHVNVMLYYLDTARDAEVPDGFNRSMLLEGLSTEECADGPAHGKRVRLHGSGEAEPSQACPG
jgi:pimeloyl-ACP methyl ester carboxylesterase